MNKKKGWLLVKKILIVFAAVLLCVRIAVSFIPLNIKNLEQTISTWLPLNISLENASVSFDGYNAAIKLKKVKFYDKDNNEVLGDCKTIIVYPYLLHSLFSFDFKLNEIVFDEPRLNLIKILAKKSEVKLPVDTIVVQKGEVVDNFWLPDLNNVNAIINVSSLELVAKADLLDGNNRYRVTLGAKQLTDKLTEFYLQSNNVALSLFSRDLLDKLKLTAISGKLNIKLSGKIKQPIYDNLSDVENVLNSLNSALVELKGDILVKDLMLDKQEVKRYSNIHGSFAFVRSLDNSTFFSMNNLAINDEMPINFYYNSFLDSSTAAISNVNLKYLQDIALFGESELLNVGFLQKIKSSEFKLNGEVGFFRIDFSKNNFSVLGEVKDLNFFDSDLKNYCQDLTALFEIKDDVGKVKITAKEIGLITNSFSDTPLIVTKIGSDLDLSNFISQDEYKITANNLHCNLGQTEFLAHSELKRMNGKSKLEVSANVKAIDALKIQEFFPHKLVNKEVLQAVRGAKNGSITDLNIDFAVSFSHQNFFMDNFNLSANFSDLMFEYSKNWPNFDKATGSLKVVKGGANFNIMEGKLFGDLPANFTIDLIKDKSEIYWLNISGDIHGSLLNFNHNAAVLFKHKILDDSKVKEGDVGLVLHLNVPLTADLNLHSKYSGVVEIAKAKVGINELSNYDFSDFNGRVVFNSQFNIAGGLNGQWLGVPIDVKLENKTIGERIVLEVTGNSVFNFDLFPDLHRVVEGAAQYNYIAQVPLGFSDSGLENNVNLKILSDLSGVTINLPFPYNKKSKIKKNTEIFFSDLFSDRQTFKINYTDLASVNISHIAAKDSVGADVNDPNIKITGWLQSINIEKIYAALQGKTKRNADKSGNFFSGNAGWLDNISYDLKFKDLNIYGLSFPQTRVYGAWLKNKIELQLSGPFVLGGMEIDSGKNEFIFKFDNLDLSNNWSVSNIENKKFNFLSGANKLAKISIKANKISFADHIVTDFSVMMEPNYHGYTIDLLYAHLPYADLFATGKWDFTTLGTIELKGFINSDDFGKTWKVLGSAPLIKYGMGDVVFDLQFNGGLLKPQLSTLRGSIRTTLNDGSVVGIAPGFSRILNLFNIQNLSKRFKLDFRDLQKSDLSFDKLYLDVNFRQGVASVKTLEIANAALKIACSGGSSLISQNVDLNVVVTPNLLGSMPIAVSIATGSIVMAPITILMDKLWGGEIAKMAERSYHVGGTWTAPLVQDVIR